MTQSEYSKKITEIKKITGEYKLIPFSTKTKKNLSSLIDEIFN